ncbi:MAG: proline dehydrogenase family protein [Acidobacteria bacterium]|uniref:proline dehydrogenase n=1 Tax=Candidatus Sulfomarinibacter kjeldsenii TaxID=2885994 RepID=A0A8J6Y7M3_9BACT|nr:proline dehydrogenase family protein [Candidatus Sulfomarinibacter kjeldsenii]
MSLFDTLVKYGMPFVPKTIVGRVARRYVAGDTLDDAVHTLRALNDEGAMGTVDILGEEVREPVKATAAVEEYLRLLDRIEDEKLDANISIKPTMLGLNVDQSLCEENLLRIVARAAQFNNFVRVDMEDHTCTDNTIRLFRQMHEEHPTSVGVVLQSYLHRTIADINSLLPLVPNIRICKGIYREPREIAWKDFETIRANFVYATEKLLSSGAYVGIATHDPHLVWAGMQIVDRLGLDHDRYEFQMLLGVDPELRRVILANGHRLRVYVPYGKDWYPYSIRRLRENPTVAHHVVRAMFR